MNEKQGKQFKRQHFVPSSYLARWFDREVSVGKEKQIWLINYANHNKFHTSVKNAFVENEMYTISDKEVLRDLSLEEALSRVESSFEKTYRTKINRSEPLTPEDVATILIYVAALKARTRKRRKQNQVMWLGIVDKAAKIFGYQDGQVLINEMRSQGYMDIKIDSDIFPPNSFPIQDAILMAEQPLQSLMSTEVMAYFKIFMNMHMSIMTAHKNSRFITSDVPVTIFDSMEGKNGYRGLALASPTIEITCPVSPTQLIFLSSSLKQSYLDMNELWVEEINRRTAFHCDKFLVSTSAEINKYWFSLFGDARLITP